MSECKKYEPAKRDEHEISSAFSIDEPQYALMVAPASIIQENNVAVSMVSAKKGHAHSTEAKDSLLPDPDPEAP